MSKTPAIPTGRLVTSAEPGTEPWFAARRGGITGTDLPKILGLSKYGNALSVWRDKRGEGADDEAREAAMWGNILEEPIARHWASLQAAPVARVGVLAHVKHDWMRASLDRLVGLCPDGDAPNGCGLEIKTRSAFKAGDFREDVPDDVLAQVQWGLMVTSFDHMHVAVLIGGQKLATFRVGRDAKLEDYLLTKASATWSAVEAGTPPFVEADADGILLRELNDMFRKREGDRELHPEEASALIADYRAAHVLETRGKAGKTKTKTALLQMLGDGETALIDGVPAFTYKPSDPTDTLPADQLRRLSVEQPELYKSMQRLGYITKTNPNPKFNLKKRSNDE